MGQPEPTPEFSRRVSVGDLGAGERIVEITADAAERVALAERLGLIALDALEARIRLSRGPTPGSVVVRGHATTDVVQSCVVTLEPVAARIEESFTLLFAPAATGSEGGEVIVEPGAEDPPEPLLGDAIDVGEAVAEHIALALDPYPRIPGAVLEAGAWNEGSGDGSGPTGPFARLRKTKGSG